VVVRFYRQAVGPTFPSVQLVPSLFPGGIKWLGHGIDHPPSSSTEVKERAGYTPATLSAFIDCCRVNVNFYIYRTT
jgi:hypothetical protein